MRNDKLVQGSRAFRDERDGGGSMAIYEAGGQLGKAMKQLLAHWEETKISWNDAAARSFEERFVVPLQRDLRSAMGALGQMAMLLDRMKRDVT